jgi:tetratricopeptide (TPR) repeat protein
MGERKHPYRPVVGPRLNKLLFVLFGVFALLAVDSIYLAGVTFLEWATGTTYQAYFYQLMFLLHLVMGLVLMPLVVAFGLLHLCNAWRHPNRRAVRAGLGLLSSALVLLTSGIILTRFGFLEVNDPHIRQSGYWIHVLAPLAVIWLFLLHRLVGPRIQWRQGFRWTAFAGSIAALMVAGYLWSPRAQQEMGPASGERYFFPSLARTASGHFIPAQSLMMEDYCRQCHEDAYQSWAHSAHHLSTFNNPAYLFSVRETRRVALERDGSVQAARFCAGCHDPVPFFSGAFDDPNFDDVNHPTADAGITCTTCHGITRLNSPRGNADYTIAEPIHYPFTFSQEPLLQWLNRQLIKAKPTFHKQTFLKPLHKTAEFCGTCHKVHLPEEVNAYKWLRGQNHYDAYLLSGVSGHGVTSFYYPEEAVPSCNVCHMPLSPALRDLGAKYFDDSGMLKVHNHLFSGANTALAHLLHLPDEVIEDQQRFLEGALRVDIFGIKAGGTIAGPLTAPLRPRVPVLEPGRRYLLETVIRTLKPGHTFTQGTADSNQVWLDVIVSSGSRVIGHSGAMAPDGTVDPWSHFVNAYILDRHGNRIDRRNAQDIFVPLYNHQIPPGAADVVHYRLQLPEDLSAPVTVEARLKYRKFDTTYVRHFQGKRFVTNDLPVTTIATDEVTFPIPTDTTMGSIQEAPEIPGWERWNDYGIGLLREGERGSSKGELRQAEYAFRRVEALGRADGPLNLARVYLKEGRLTQAAKALRRAAKNPAPAPAWSVAWLSGLINKQSGHLDAAIDNFTQLVETRFLEARARGFDFSKDYRLLNELGQTLFERAKRERGPANAGHRYALLEEAKGWFAKTLALDPENVTAHYDLALISAQLGEHRVAEVHRQLHRKYKPDDNAGDRVIAIHRRQHPAADHAAEAVVLYDLQRPSLETETPEFALHAKR